MKRASGLATGKTPACHCVEPSKRQCLTDELVARQADDERAAMHGRALTPGETALARSVFGDAIDYARVRMFLGKFWPFQPRRSAMAPMGDIFFHPDGGGWSDDFSAEPVARQGFFIHEMTHVWQAQRGGRLYLPLMRHPFCRYSYRLVPGRRFGLYGLEQQAEIVRHRFLADHGAEPPQCPPRGLLDFFTQ